MRFLEIRIIAITLLLANFIGAASHGSPRRWSHPNMASDFTVETRANHVAKQAFQVFLALAHHENPFLNNLDAIRCHATPHDSPEWRDIRCAPISAEHITKEHLPLYENALKTLIMDYKDTSVFLTPGQRFQVVCSKSLDQDSSNGEICTTKALKANVQRVEMHILGKSYGVTLTFTL